MARKMYYTEEEAAAKLGCSVDELSQFVTDQKIRVFKDGLRNVYTAEEVDALAVERGVVSEEPEEPQEPRELEEPKEPEGPEEPKEPEELEELEEPEEPKEPEEIELAPTKPAEIELAAVEDEIELTHADTEKDAISLSEFAEEPAPAEKEDTVLSSEGASIFDDADFDVEGADPMAKTQVAPSLDEQIAMEGVGSGSGLLDLTRESDDTSLGAEILEHIDADSAEVPPVEELLGEEPDLEAAPAAAPLVAPQPTLIEAADPMSGLFGGIAAGAALVVFVVAGIALAALGSYTPGYLDWLSANMLAMLMGSIAVIGLGALVGFLVGKSVADKQAAIRRAGG